MLDQGSVIRSGMAIVPDYAQQAALAQQQELQKQQFALQQRQFQAQQQKAAQDNQERTDFSTAVEVYQRSGDPQDLINLMARFPKQSEGLKRAHDAQEKDKRDGDLRQATEIYSYARAGRFDLAAKSLERRINAEREAGMEVDPEDEQMLADLKSGDPNAQKSALAKAGMSVAVATGPDKFASTYGELNPEAKQSPLIREYQDRVAQFGKEAADKWLAIKDAKLIPVQAGGAVYDAAEFVGGAPQQPAVQKPGGPVKNGSTVMQEIFPGIRITQNRRDPNSKLGKANPKSWHVKSGGAVDVAPIQGMPFKDFLKRIRSAGYTIIEARDEVKNPSKHATGPHWHVVLGKGPGRQKPVSKTVSGQTYYQVDGKWYDNPEGK